MRGNHHIAGNPGGQQVERAGVHDNGRHRVRVGVLHCRITTVVVGSGLVSERIMCQQSCYRLTLDIVTVCCVRGRGDARTDDPGVHMPFADDRFRQRLQHEILGALQAEIAYHADA